MPDKEKHLSAKSLAEFQAEIDKWIQSVGGGYWSPHENLARIVPQGVRIIIERGRWPVPPLFNWLQRLGEVEQAEMDQVFNMGIGMVMVVAPSFAESIRKQLKRQKLESWIIGRAESGPQGVEWGKIDPFEA